MKNLKKFSSFLSVCLSLSVVLGNFSLPVLAYEKDGVNFEQVRTKTTPNSDGELIDKTGVAINNIKTLPIDKANKENLSEPKKKLGTDLLKLIDNSFLLPNQNRIQVVFQMKGLKQFVASGDSVTIIDKRVVNQAHNDLVYVYVSLKATAQTSIIDSLVWKVTDRDEKNHLAVALVEVNKLEALASLSEVRSIRSVMPPIVQSGSVVTEGDIIHQTDKVRANYSQGGAGIKIGVISDGVNHITSAQATSDLSSVTVLDDTQVGDEGTAMLEIIHDMVPDAQLYFHTGFPNAVVFNNAVNDLVAARVNIIVDDLNFSDQPFFEDGTVASNVASVLATKNIVYVSAAGNAGSAEYNPGHYQGEYYNNGYNFHDFSRGSKPTFKNLYVNIPSGGSVVVVLQWNDSFGSSGNDYDLYMDNVDGSVPLASNATIQDGNDNPLEGFSYTNTTGSTIDASIWVNNYLGLAAAKTLELFIRPKNGTSVYNDNLTPVDSIFGHPAVPGVIAVGAIAANDLGNDTIESFSSQGPVTIIGQGQRAKPDIAGIDRVAITGAGGFPVPFYGTSAAAPHIAAIVAQLWGEYPLATGNQIRGRLLNSAVDLGTPGVDSVFGHGRADSLLDFQAGPTITSFNFAGLTPSVTGVINEGAKTITATVPYGTNVTALIPTIAISTGTSISPLTGVAKNFTNPVIYTATSADGLIKPYTVTVTVAPNLAKAITAFSFATPVATGVINETAHTIAVTVPFGTNVTALVPTIIVSTGASVNPASGVAHNFTSPVTYTVTAASGLTQTYTVTVTVAGGGISTTFGYSPIADAYINKQNKNKNQGGVNELQIKSHSNKNTRTSIKFDFHLPSGITIISSTLKLYMKSAPSVSRTYEAKRVLANWNEKNPRGINWNNQPSVDTAITNSVQSGTAKNVWLSWNVTNDVRNFINDPGSYPNYGWQLKDSNEDSSTAYEAKFHSRESKSIALRPILEVQFSAPKGATDHLVINEVYYHIGSGKGKEINNEWVEIYNPTDSAINISGWQICNKNSCDIIPTSNPIPGKGFAVITYKSSTWDKWSSIPRKTIKIVLNSAIGNGLANNGDRVILKNTSGTVDAMSYGKDTTYFKLPLSGKGKSLARIIGGYDTNLATDWIINTTPNPGTNPSVTE